MWWLIVYGSVAAGIFLGILIDNWTGGNFWFGLGLGLLVGLLWPLCFAYVFIKNWSR